MQIPPHNPELIAKRAIELFGGPEAFFAAADKEREEINTRWNQNVSTIGRILRAHLFVEHYLTQYLAKANPRLGSMTEARVSFAQKVSLLDTSESDIAAILPGIKRLNAIRNRLAHNLSAQVTQEDAKVLLQSERFAALRAARAPKQVASTDPLDVLDDFALHTSMVFTYEFSPVSQAIAKAIDEVHFGREAT
ncbi:MAG TPA: hypothetical protein VJ673_23165 [Aromatoleum sp.]|uniref:hypothetical protein n=1 Tax=Aromatoleum sp. TaxID=2307007 RepID=UPI002B465AD8|nr:hypothetical protein [Aromatoleum sp.]HJV28599.1 hypothetical protein [Aromatoleum sp.]